MGGLCLADRVQDRLNAEVLSAAERWGTVEFDKILWPLVYTQRMMVFRKKP